MRRRVRASKSCLRYVALLMVVRTPVAGAQPATSDATAPATAGPAAATPSNETTPAAGATTTTPPAPDAAAPATPATTPPKADEAGVLDARPAKARTSALDAKLARALETAQAQRERVEKLRQRGLLSEPASANMSRQLTALTALLTSFRQRAATNLQQAQSETEELRRTAEADEPLLGQDVSDAITSLRSLEALLDEKESASGWPLVQMLLRSRCATAICFDNGDKKDWIGIEPLVELPIGKSFSLSSSALGNYTNNHDIRVDLAAGVRVWLFRDIVSLSVYISKPLTDARVRLEGSSFVYPASAIRRPYPGVAVGALFDTLWFGFDRDELRNGDGQDPAARNPAFPPNSVVSSNWTLTVSLQPVTAFRTAIGTGVQATKQDGAK